MLAAGRGDRDAFGTLVERHYRAVMRFIYRFLGDAGRETVEDLTQDVFLGAWKAAGTFKPRAKVTTWLLQIAAHTCLNYRRGMRLRRMRSYITDPEPRGFSPRGVSAQAKACGSSDPVDGPITSRDQAAHVRAAVARLPPNQRGAIVLRYFHDLSYAEIAEVLETSVSAVESLLFRARKTLRAVLAEKDEDVPQVLPELGAEHI